MYVSKKLGAENSIALSHFYLSPVNTFLVAHWLRDRELANQVLEVGLNEIPITKVAAIHVLGPGVLIPVSFSTAYRLQRSRQHLLLTSRSNSLSSQPPVQQQPKMVLVDFLCTTWLRLIVFLPPLPPFFWLCLSEQARKTEWGNWAWSLVKNSPQYLFNEWKLNWVQPTKWVFTTTLGVFHDLVHDTKVLFSLDTGVSWKDWLQRPIWIVIEALFLFVGVSACGLLVVILAMIGVILYGLVLCLTVPAAGMSFYLTAVRFRTEDQLQPIAIYGTLTALMVLLYVAETFPITPDCINNVGYYFFYGLQKVLEFILGKDEKTQDHRARVIADYLMELAMRYLDI